MGHFSFTCSVSDLAITGGTPVRCLLLTSSPYGDDDSRKSWVVRTPPIRAKYNEYGSIEDINKEDEFTANLWLRGLREDLVEKGTGDNQCHDVPTSKDMTFDQLLEALWERRVEVMQDVRHFWRRPMIKEDLIRIGDDDIVPTEPLDRSAPMFKRIERILEKHGQKQYLVDEPVPNVVRVRFKTDRDNALNWLYSAKNHVDTAGFVSVVTAGTGRYADSADLLVFNPPNKEERSKGAHWDMATGQKSADDKCMAVRLAMVREDVWQALITYPRSQGVYLDCTACGQEAYYHDRDRRCPSKMINKKPLKPHKKGSTYTHGPVFSKDVPHLVLVGEYREEVWYGLDAFKAGVRKAWQKVLDYFDKQDRRSRGETVEEDEDETPSGRRAMDKFMREIEAARKKEDARIAALPEAERAALEATRKAEREAWEAREKERRDNPVFGDYLITDGIVPRGDDHGSWAFHSELPGVIGIPDHLSMCLADKLEVPLKVIDSMAELMAFQYAMGEVGAVWKPASSTGPQDPEWAFYVRYNETLAQISRKGARHREEKEPLPVTLEEAIKRFTPKPKKAVEPVKKKANKKR